MIYSNRESLNKNPKMAKIRKTNLGISKSKKHGGAVKLTEGPFDSATHSELSSSQLAKHINTMQKRLQGYHEKLVSEKDKFQEKSVELQNKKSSYDEKLLENLKKAHDAQMRANEKIQENSRQAIDNGTNTVKQTVIGLFVALKAFLTAAWKVIKTFVKRFIQVVCWLAEFIYKGISEFITTVWQTFFHGRSAEALIKTVGNFMGAVLLMILAFLLVIAFLIFILWLIWPEKVESWFKKPKQIQDGTGGSGENGEELGNVVEINIANFGVIASKGLTTTFNDLLGNTYDKLSVYDFRPQFPSIPKTPTFNILNPFDGIKSFYEEKKFNFMKSDVMQTITKTINMASPSDVITTPRPIIESGRSDNVIMINAELINDKDILSDRNIILSKTSINIAKPDDIKWNMPENDYANKDYEQVPKSLRSKKDANNISINDKKSVIIPWKKENNNYTLSCSDAYFENNVEEKANLIIDNNDGNTCTFNIESKPVSYTETKERYKYSQDLSKYL